MKKMNFNFFNRKVIASGENSNEKLERFTKKKKEKNIIIASIVGIVLIIGGIILYRSYALYEEKQNFDVLQGKVGDFRYDVKMAVTVDGQSVDKIPDKGLYDTTVTCNGTGQGTWDYITWNLTLAGFQTGERCLLAFTSNPNLKEEDLIANGVALRRNTYRGKDISSYWKDGSLYTMISNGTFDDIYVGDYIVDNNGNKWLIADLDNYLYSGNTSLTKHHATIISAKNLMSGKMNDTNTIEGGYAGSKMAKETLVTYLNTYVTPTFGTHVITYNTLVTSTTSNGKSTAFTWTNRQIDLMSEVNVYGTTVWSSSGFDIGIDNRQYAIFQLRPELINSDVENNRISYWLKDVVNAFGFAGVDARAGGSAGISTTATIGIRPRFLIG